jgi:hypothetical protein
MIPRAGTIVLALCAGCGVLAQPIEIEPSRPRGAHDHLRFSSCGTDDVRRGRVAKHGLPSHAAGEVAVAGVPCGSSAEGGVLRSRRDIARFKSGPAVLQIGRFSHPPALEISRR